MPEIALPVQQEGRRFTEPDKNAQIFYCLIAAARFRSGDRVKTVQKLIPNAEVVVDLKTLKTFHDLQRLSLCFGLRESKAVVLHGCDQILQIKNNGWARWRSESRPHGGLLAIAIRNQRMGLQRALILLNEDHISDSTNVAVNHPLNVGWPAQGVKPSKNLQQKKMITKINGEEIGVQAELRIQGRKRGLNVIACAHHKK